MNEKELQEQQEKIKAIAEKFWSLYLDDSESPEKQIEAIAELIYYGDCNLEMLKTRMAL